MPGPSMTACAKALDPRRRARWDKPPGQRANHATAVQPPPAIRMQGSGLALHRQPPCCIQSPTAAGRSLPQFPSPIAIAGPFPCCSTTTSHSRNDIGSILQPVSTHRSPIGPHLVLNTSTSSNCPFPLQHSDASSTLVATWRAFSLRVRRSRSPIPSRSSERRGRLLKRQKGPEAMSTSSIRMPVPPRRPLLLARCLIPNRPLALNSC